MSQERNLRPDRSITGAIIPLSILPIFGIVALIFGLKIGLITLGGLLGAISIFYAYVLARTGNPAQLVFMAEGGFLGALFILLGLDRIASKDFRVAYIATMIFFAVIIIVLAVTRRSQWRGREIFELAAETVDETGNGYTARPRPLGKVEFSSQQIRSFARFCARHLIALPYFSTHEITLVPIKMGDEIVRMLGFKGDYRQASWVSFSQTGDVSVHISQDDYLQYREPLSFDKLCASFGKLFTDFLELHGNGEGRRVINRLDDIKLGIFE